MKNADYLYALTLRGKKVADENLRSKGFDGAVHLLPSQNVVFIQTYIAMEIMAGGMEAADLIKEDFLPVNAFATNAATRARDLGRFEQSTNLQGLHGQYSLLYKQHISIKELLAAHPDITYTTPKKRKALIFEFFARMKCDENDLRKRIGEGTWRPRDWKAAAQ